MKHEKMDHSGPAKTSAEPRDIEADEIDTEGQLPGSPAGYDTVSSIRSPEVRGVSDRGRHTHQGAGPNQGSRES